MKTPSMCCYPLRLEGAPDKGSASPETWRVWELRHRVTGCIGVALREEIKGEGEPSEKDLAGWRNRR
jgi:hypothetical protein